MTARLAEAIRYLYPDVSLISDVVVEDDGSGPRIAAWRVPGERPTDQQIADALAAIDSEPPPRRLVVKSLVISRLIEAGNRGGPRCARGRRVRLRPLVGAGQARNLRRRSGGDRAVAVHRRRSGCDLDPRIVVRGLA